MRHIIYLNSVRKVYDGQLKCPLVVVGQRDVAHARTLLPAPVKQPQPGEEPSEAFLDYRKAVADLQRQSVAGRFSETVIEWCETPEEAAEIVAKFTAPEWINVRIKDVETILP